MIVNVVPTETLSGVDLLALADGAFLFHSSVKSVNVFKSGESNHTPGRGFKFTSVFPNLLTHQN